MQAVGSGVGDGDPYLDKTKKEASAVGVIASMANNVTSILSGNPLSISSGITNLTAPYIADKLATDSPAPTPPENNTGIWPLLAIGLIAIMIVRR